METRVAPTTAAAMAQHWDARAHRFDAAASHRRDPDAWRTVFRAALGETPRDVVDLGAGTGACAVLAAALGHRVTAVDGSAAMLGEAQAAAAERGVSVRFVHATMDDADLPAASADVVTIRNVLWTLENPLAALRLARTLLRPGGMLLVSDGVWFRRRANDSAATFGAHLPFYNGLTEADARRLLAEAGFGGVEDLRHLMPGDPYGAVYDDPATPIAFFILTAIAPE